MFSCGGLCSVQNKDTDTVTVSLPPRFEAEDGAIAEKRAAEEEVEKRFAEKWLFISEEFVAARHQAAVQQWKTQMEQEEEARREALRLAQEQAAAEEEAQRVAKEAAATRAEEEKAAAAAAAAAADAAAAAEEEEEKKKQAAAATATRKAAVQAFLKEHGYAGPAASKRTLMKTTYPLHEAAKRGDAKMVTMLLEEGASQKQQNSRGKTALQRAQQADRKGSHAEVIRLLGGKPTAGKVGGA